jgi:hypothetical protein
MENEIESLKVSMAEFKKDIEFIKQGQGKNDVQHEEILAKIEESSREMRYFINTANDTFVRTADHKETMRLFGLTIASLDDKFAPKIIWNILCWAGGVSGGLLITGIIYLLVNAFLHLNK